VTAERGDGPTTLLYIGGSGRSGSTLVECLLARLDDVVVLGEVAHLWLRGIRGDELCACGEHFSACPFWSEVGTRAFGSWAEVPVDRVLALKQSVDRQRRMTVTGRRNPPAPVAKDAEEYSEYYRRIYDAARAITGAGVVVDSSKVPPTALCLSYNRDLDLRVLHIVRDSRGVAYSWTKVVERPETEGGESMPQLPVTTSTGLWLSHNLSMAALKHRGVPLTRIRYEELVEDAAGTIKQAWRDLGLPGSGELPMIDPTTIELRPTHSVAGNPMRFRAGRTTLRRDDAWRRDMPRRDRALVTAMTYPALRAMGYRGRAS
jgi:hypothetical protein